MSQLVTYSNGSDGATARRYTGFPLNSTLVSSYTPDTIRSIINQAASGQPYSTSVWIRISRVGIQISAQDSQIARTRKPVFIPVGLVHDIFMQPNINNVICVVYDEVQSNMKGVLLYVVHPTDAQLIRDDFRIVKQANNNPQALPSTVSSPFDNRYSTAVDMFSPDANQQYSPVPPRRSSPRRAVYVRDDDPSLRTTDFTKVRYTPTKGSQTSGKDESEYRRGKSPRKARYGKSSSRQSDDRESKPRRKHRSRSPEKQVKVKTAAKSNSQEFTQEQIRQQQQLALEQQQQQLAAWQASQQMPLFPVGIYNRYVPKTIPLPSGETLKTSLPPPGMNGAAGNPLGVAFIEPMTPSNSRGDDDDGSRPAPQSNPPPRRPVPEIPINTLQPTYYQRQQSNGMNGASSRVQTNPPNVPSQPAPVSSKPPPARTNETTAAAANTENTDDTKRYLKALVDEMQSLKLEMSKIRQSSIGTTANNRTRSDSIHVDLKQLRSDIDLIRARISMTPKIPQ